MAKPPDGDLEGDVRISDGKNQFSPEITEDGERDKKNIEKAFF